MQIITVKEVADFLRLKASTVCRLASEGKLPGVKVGKSWRFDRVALERLVGGASAKAVIGSACTPTQAKGLDGLRRQGVLMEAEWREGISPLGQLDSLQMKID